MMYLSGSTPVSPFAEPRLASVYFLDYLFNYPKYRITYLFCLYSQFIKVYVGNIAKRCDGISGLAGNDSKIGLDRC